MMPPPLHPPLHVLLWFLLLIPIAAFRPAWVKGGPRRAACSVATLRATAHHHRNILVLSHNVSQDVADGFFDVNGLLHGRVDVLARCVNSGLWVSNGIRQDTSVFLMLFPHNITIEIQGYAVRNLNPDERTMALYLQHTLLVGVKEESEDGLSSELSLAGQRREVELFRLRETKRQRPETINPFKPGALPKSERQKLQVIRKQREAMVRRINRALLDDDAPVGFTLHQNDSLEARLKQFSSTGPVLMFDELGEPLSNALLESLYDSTEKDTETTTLILGDQMGYAASDEQRMVENNGVLKVSLGPLSLLTSQCITISHHYLDAARLAHTSI
jgi:tRNA pseudouridine-54 N-methylase